MSKIEYTKKQIQELLKNPYVKNCSNKYITFTDKFKIKALELDAEWIYHRQIFKDFWFPEYIVTSKVVSNSLWNWRHKFKYEWLSWLVWTKKGRKKWEKKDISKMSKDEQIEYFKTENAFLKEMYKRKYWDYP